MAEKDRDRLRWGVLGAAAIATRKVIPAMQKGHFTTVTAIASRDLARAKTAAAALAIDKAYGSYEELLADPEIDAVYNPLPNHLHVPWTVRAAEAGKHVLCEKPIALSSAEARTLLEVRDRTGVTIQEAFMVRSHPQWLAARKLVREGRIGNLRAMLGVFSYFNEDPANIRNVPAFGGGALMDIGCYLINTSRFITGREPDRVAGAVERDPTFGTDRVTSLLLDFGGMHLAGTCSTQMVPWQRIQIFGTGGHELLTFPVCDQYTIQGDLFSKAVLNGSEAPEPLEDSIRNMECIEAVFRSADSGRWERPGQVSGPD
jgi:predicted dehydrogenase